MFIYPEKRDCPVRHGAWVVYGLILINVLVFLAVWSPVSFDSVARRFGFTPANPHGMTVFTAMFLHAGLLHLLGNMLFLWIFGESVEDALGHLQTLACYLASGVFGTLVYYLANTRSTI